MNKKLQIKRFVTKHFEGKPFNVRKEHLSTEEIIAFHDNTVNSAERQQIEAHLEHCEVCCELLQAAEALEGVRIQEESLKTSSSASEFFHRVMEWLVHRPFYPIAATVGVVLFIILFLNEQKMDVYSNLVEIAPAPYISSELRGEKSAQELFNQGMSFYLANDFQSALPFLERAAARHPENAQYRFFLGVTLLLNQKYEAGIKQLRQASVLASAYRDEAYWYVAQAYLKLNQPEQAKELLRMLESTPGAYANQAANLLQKLGHVEGKR